MSISLQIIFSQFDDRIGPISKATYPENIPKKTSSIVSTMTIDLLTYSDENLNEIAIFEFPSLNKKGLVKIIQWKDDSSRGGFKLSSLTILFEERDDLILYKYKLDIEETIEKTLKNVLSKLKRSTTREQFIEPLEEIYQKLQNLFQSLSNQEMKGADLSKPFPKVNSNENQDNFAAKTIIVGDPGVGKTSTVLQFTEKAFHRSYIPTIGVNVTEKILVYNNAKFHFFLWDLAGQSKFHRIRTLYYNGAHCIVLIFDLTNSNSFANIEKWYKDLKKNIDNFPNLEVILCGNKSDLHEEIKISSEQTKNLATKWNIEYLETSAKNGKNIQEIFINLIKKMIARKIITL